MMRNLIAPDPNKARTEIASRQRGRSSAEAAANWPSGCMARVGPRHDERCCKRATEKVNGEPRCAGCKEAGR